MSSQATVTMPLGEYQTLQHRADDRESTLEGYIALKRQALEAEMRADELEARVKELEAQIAQANHQDAEIGRLVQLMPPGADLRHRTTGTWEYFPPHETRSGFHSSLLVLLRMVEK